MTGSRFEENQELWDADWSNKAADVVVEELVCAKLFSPDLAALARGLVSRELLYLLASGVRPKGKP
jgi:hypothetical protein